MEPHFEQEAEITEVDGIVLHDLESKYSTVMCPVHAAPPNFEEQPDGSIVERICCEALRQIMTELEAADPTTAVDIPRF